MAAIEGAVQATLIALLAVATAGPVVLEHEGDPGVWLPEATFREYVRAHRAEASYHAEIDALRRALTACQLEVGHRTRTASIAHEIGDMWRSDALACRASVEPCNCTLPAVVSGAIGAATCVAATWAVRSR